MLAPTDELRAYTGLKQPAAIVRALARLGAPARVNAVGLPAVPAEWWARYKAGSITPPAPPITTPAANDEPNTLRLDRLPRGRRRRA